MRQTTLTSKNDGQEPQVYQHQDHSDMVCSGVECLPGAPGVPGSASCQPSFPGTPWPPDDVKGSAWVITGVTGRNKDG